MPRRTLYDPLQRLAQSTWLVTRNPNRLVLEAAELPPGTDLRSVLGSARDTHMAAGWSCTALGPAVGFYFAERDGERVQVGIERYDPYGPRPPGHCDPRRNEELTGRRQKW